MRHTVLAATLIVPTALSAQTAGTDVAQTLSDPSAIADSASKAASTLTGKAKEHVLVRQMLGQQVTGPGGDVLGTLDNLVVVPGGQVVAVVVKPEQGQPVVLPYQALKVSAASSASEKLGLTLPMSLKEAKDMSAIQDLTSTVLEQNG